MSQQKNQQIISFSKELDKETTSCIISKYTKEKTKEKKFWNKNKYKDLRVAIKFIISLNIFFPILSSNISDVGIFNFSTITLKIRGIGPKNIFCEENLYFEEDYYPDEVYINGIRQNIVNYSYYFDQVENYVDLIWNNSITTLSNIFYRCPDIIEIDLSKFDSSNVTDLNYMFYGYSSVTSLNLSNFITSKVNCMSNMFSNCSSLTSLDVSNFDTSQVNLMDYMFSNCSSLTSLNLSNFNVKGVSIKENMFEGCINLEYINLKNFE